MRRIHSTALIVCIGIQLVVSIFFASTVSAAIGDTCEKHAMCGAAANSCGSGEICIDPVPWDPFSGGTCQAGGSQCENRDTSTGDICGYTGWAGNDGWCNAQGGCAAGSVCLGSNKECVPSSACAYVASGEVQCYSSRWTRNKCGDDGGCMYGYRCGEVTSEDPLGSIRFSGIACRPDVSGAADACPGTPQGEEEVLACGMQSANPNVVCNCAGNPSGDPHYNSTNNRYCCGWLDGASCLDTAPSQATPVVCGTETTNPNGACGCSGIPDRSLKFNSNTNKYCCGWITNGSCGSTPPPNENPGGGTGGGGTTEPTPTPLNIFEGPSSADFNMLNPFVSMGADPEAAQYFTSPAGIISRILLFAFPLAGLILFAMLVWAGFQIVTGAMSSGSKAIEAGRQRATNAIVGFFLLFVSYWIMQVLEVIFGIKFL